MRIFKALFILLAVLVSDVASYAFCFHTERWALSDASGEMESEKEGEFESETKEESKIQNYLSIYLGSQAEESPDQDLFQANDRYLTPYRKIHSPPPDTYTSKF